MRDAKTTGGLTRGRGMTESQRAKWVLSIPECAQVNNALQEATGTRRLTSDQHVEMGSSRSTRDTNDMMVITSYLKERTPFADDPTLRNIAAGVVGDASVNVSKAKDAGLEILKSMEGQTAAELTLKKKIRSKRWQQRDRSKQMETQSVLILNFCFNASLQLRILLIRISKTSFGMNCAAFPQLYLTHQTFCGSPTRQHWLTNCGNCCLVMAPLPAHHFPATCNLSLMVVPYSRDFRHLGSADVHLKASLIHMYALLTIVIPKLLLFLMDTCLDRLPRTWLTCDNQRELTEILSISLQTWFSVQQKNSSWQMLKTSSDLSLLLGHHWRKSAQLFMPRLMLTCR